MIVGRLILSYLMSYHYDLISFEDVVRTWHIDGGSGRASGSQAALGPGPGRDQASLNTPQQYRDTHKRGLPL